MILRKLADAIREQNWFTVLLEILIVVIGIVIGLQVDDWNEARKNRIDEAKFLSRLHDDIVNSEALSRRGLEKRLYYAGNLVEVIDIIFGRQPADHWTQDHCQIMAATSSINLSFSLTPD